MEHILKILTLAETSEHIGIVLGPASGDAELLAAHALKERLGEKAAILNAPEHLQDRWSHLFKKERPRKEVALVIDTVAHPVDELRYEKEGTLLRIFLSPPSAGGNQLTKEAFLLEERHHPCDMIISFGFQNDEELTHALKKETPLKNPDALIDLSHTLQAAPAPEAPTPTPRRWDISAMKLWSRALLRSYTEDGMHVFWAFLPKEDFQKTGTSPQILPALVADMRRAMEIPAICIVLWQDQETPADNVHILVSTSNKETLTRISAATETTPEDGYLIIRGFPNFSEAEAEMRKLLKNAM